MGDREMRSATALDIVREICDSIDAIDQEYAKLKSAMSAVIGVDAVKSLSIIELIDAAQDCFNPVMDGMERHSVAKDEIRKEPE